MCIIFVAKNQHPSLPFILAANRDEFYQRPTRAAHFWPTHPKLLAGQDLQAGGSWLGVTKSGRFAALTNIRRQEVLPKNLQSRGTIITQCLTQQSLQDSLENLQENRSQFAGFNLLAGDLLSELVYLSSDNNKQYLNDGIYGLSNAQLDSPWPKLEFGKKNLTQLVQQDFDIDAWFALLANKQNFAEQSLPDTGIGMAQERVLAPIFIQSPNYGTRASTIITANKNGNINFYERSFNEQGLATNQQHFQWNIFDNV